MSQQLDLCCWEVPDVPGTVKTTCGTSQISQELPRNLQNLQNSPHSFNMQQWETPGLPGIFGISLWYIGKTLGCLESPLLSYYTIPGISGMSGMLQLHPIGVHGTFLENTSSQDPIRWIFSLMRMYLIGSDIRQPKVRKLLQIYFWSKTDS